MSIYLVSKTTSMIVISFLEQTLCRTYIYPFIIITNSTIFRSMAIRLHLVYYTFKLTFQGLNNTDIFLSLVLLLLIKFATLGIQLELNLTVFLLNILYRLLNGKKLS